MMYELPKAVEVSGNEYEIRSDYRAVLDICAALNDPELSDDDRGLAVLTIFYPDLESIPLEHHNEAIQKCFWFIRRGEDDRKKPTLKLLDWEQDFMHIVSPVNRVLGCEVRAVEYMHWWTFISAYYEIGECLFSQIVNIRSKRAKNKKLDKGEQEFYNQNADIIDIKTLYTESENGILEEWGAK